MSKILYHIEIYGEYTLKQKSTKITNLEYVRVCGETNAAAVLSDERAIYVCNNVLITAINLENLKNYFKTGSLDGITYSKITPN